MRQNRGLIVAGAVFTAVVVLFVFFDLKQPKQAPSSSPTPQPSPVVGLAAGQLQQVVVHAKGKVLTVTRNGNNFTYSDCPAGQGDCPAQAADTTASGQFYQQLAALSPSKVIFGAPEGLPAYGVDKPTTAEIDIKGAANQQATVLVGIKSPDSSSYFARRQDSNDILAVAAATVDALLALVDTPPVPQPSPAASAPAAAASPSAQTVGPVPPSP